MHYNASDIQKDTLERNSCLIYHAKLGGFLYYTKDSR